MSIQVDFYVFSKKQRSTARPTAGATSVSCDIKANSSILAPSLLINMGSNNAPLFNYCYIADYERYYFISNWTYEQGLWRASCSVDALASWKTYIGSNSFYVLRSSNTFDGNILDNNYPLTDVLTSPLSVCTQESPPYKSTGCFVVGVISGSGSGLGAVTYYLINRATMRSLLAFMFADEPSYATIVKTAFNPFEYIASCMYLPFEASDIVADRSNTEAIQFGWWTSDIQGYVLYNVGKTFSGSISIPKHPQAATRGSFCNLAPASRYYLYFPPFGQIALDPTYIANASTLHYAINLDPISGEAELMLSTEALALTYTGNTAFITVSGKLGYNVPLAQINVDYVGAAAHAVGAVASIASKNIGGTFANILSTAESMFPQVQQSGGMVAVGALHNKVTLAAFFMELPEDDNSHQGRPLCQNKTISSIPGYIKVLDGDISFPGTAEELSTVKNMMEGGFFYE